MKQVHGNPTRNETLSLDTFEIVSTDASGYINVSSDISNLASGTEVIVTFDGGDANGWVDGETYYLIPVTSGQVGMASSRVNAQIGGTVSGVVSGDAGAGDMYPVYHVGGTLFVGTGGTMSVKGIDSNSFSTHKNVDNGTLWPMMIEEIHTWVGTGNTNVSDCVAWYG